MAGDSKDWCPENWRLYGPEESIELLRGKPCPVELSAGQPRLVMIYLTFSPYIYRRMYACVYRHEDRMMCAVYRSPREHISVSGPAAAGLAFHQPRRFSYMPEYIYRDACMPSRMRDRSNSIPFPTPVTRPIHRTSFLTFRLLFHFFTFSHFFSLPFLTTVANPCKIYISS